MSRVAAALSIAMAFLMALAVVAPRAAFAAQEERRPLPSDVEESFVLRVNGPVHVGPGEREGAVVVVDDDANIEGYVRDQVVVVNGAGTIAGTVDGDVLIVNGHLHLGPEARVNDVVLVRSTLSQAPGAVITGAVSERRDFGWGFGLGTWLVWLSVTALMVLAGVLFAAVGGRQLGDAAAQITLRPGASVVAAVLLWVVAPLVAVLLLFTILGIPVGLLILALLLPALWFLGYLVTGAAIGALLTGARRTVARAEHPYGAAALGALLLQAVSLVPFVGAIVAILAGLLGGGALVLRSWRVLRGAPRNEAAFGASR